MQTRMLRDPWVGMVIGLLCFGVEAVASLPTGQAAVTLTAGGRSIPLTHAYARLELDLESREQVAVLLTDATVPDALLDRGVSLWDLLANAGIANGLHFRLSGEGRGEDWKVVHPNVNTGCGICSDWVAQASQAAGTVQGKVFTAAVQTTGGTRWEFRGEFNAELKPGWEAAAEAKATPAQRGIRKQLRADGNHFTPDGFFLAALMNPASVKLYLDAGMPPDTPNPDTGDTMLLGLLGGADLSSAQRAAVRELIRRGADVNRGAREGGGTPLARAFCCADVVRALLDAGAKMGGPSGQPGQTAAQMLMNTAIAFDKPDVIRLLVDRGYPVAAEREKLLESASGRPEIEAILRGTAAAKAPAEAPPAVRSTSKLPAEAPPGAVPARAELSPAAARQALAARQIAFTSEEFWFALMDQDAERVLLFLDAGMDPNQRRESIQDTPLLFASTWNFSEHAAARTAIILGLIAHGADVNALDTNDATPLLHAAQYCPADVVRAMLKAGAKAKVQAKGGATPMMMAVIFGRADNVKALLEGGYDVKPELESLLQIAAGHPEIQQMLKAAAKR